MKILLVGPCPPPHGGVSVHIAGIHQRLAKAGVPCEVLDPSRFSNRSRFLLELSAYASRGWTIHLHTNGHNRKSWLLALACGLAAKAGRSPFLTLHSGLAPAYLEQAGWADLCLARQASRLFHRILCVTQEIQLALASLQITTGDTEVVPAYLASDLPHGYPDPLVAAWMARRSPVFSAAMFFQPEYGLGVLINGLALLRTKHPALGCIILGGGEAGRLEAESQVRCAGLADNFLFVGDISHSRCLALIERCDVFLRPTLADGDSLSVREALAMGVPVVASRVGTRPSGATLFRPGDVGDFVARIEDVLAAPAPSPVPSFSNMDRLLECYQANVPSEGTYV